MKVLISDKLSDTGIEIFNKTSGLEVINDASIGKDVDKLKKAIADVDAIAIRSGTKLTKDVLSGAKRLKVIGRAGIGVDNIDIDAASKMGIIVMNTPGGNVVTTAEHAISMMCALSRNIPQATASIKGGKWEKSKFMGSELYRKTLGIIGCGNIGKTVASRAQGLKLNVISFDPFLSDELAQELNIKKVTLGELFKQSDYITVHTPLNDKTKYLIDKEAFKQMKKGVYIINCARGGIVKEDDLCWALESGIVAGAALDVFEKEPVDPNNPLLHMDNVICTPHLGASTEEAQENVAVDIANQIVDYLVNGNIINSINTASASAEVLKKLGPAIKLGEKLGSLQGQLCTESPKEILINYYGEITTQKTAPITTAILQGVLQSMLSDDSINSVNAPYLAKERGITVKESKISTHSDYSMLIEIALKFKGSESIVAGSIFGKGHPRIVYFNNIFLEVNPTGQILIVENEDKPGVVGNVGTFLGNKHVNISNLQLGLDEKTKMATTFYSVDGDLNGKVLTELGKLDGIVSVRKVFL